MSMAMAPKLSSGVLWTGHNVKRCTNQQWVTRPPIPNFLGYIYSFLWIPYRKQKDWNMPMFMSPKASNTLLWMLDNVVMCGPQLSHQITDIPFWDTYPIFCLIWSPGLIYAVVQLAWLLKIQNIYLINQYRYIGVEFTFDYICFMWFQFCLHPESRWLECAHGYVSETFQCIIIDTRHCRMMCESTLSHQITYIRLSKTCTILSVCML